MKRLEWDDCLSLGIQDIDDQHRKLIGYVNSYIDAVAGKRDQSVLKGLLKDLRDYTLTHFADEERYMASVKYPKLEEHRRFHEVLARRVKDYQRSTFRGEVLEAKDFIEFLKTWLIDHILRQDTAIARFVKGAKAQA